MEKKEIKKKLDSKKMGKSNLNKYEINKQLFRLDILGNKKTNFII